MKNDKYLYTITLAFFALSLVNIHFAILGMICMAIPFYLLQRDTKTSTLWKTERDRLQACRKKYPSFRPVNYTAKKKTLKEWIL